MSGHLPFPEDSLHEKTAPVLDQALSKHLHDPPTLRTALRDFEHGTEALPRLQDPPSTGVTPQSSPPNTPSDPSGSTISNPSESTGLTTKASSAEEAIYDRPSGPQLPTVPAVMDEEAVRRIITSAVQATVAQSVQAAVAQLANAAAPPQAPGENTAQHITPVLNRWNAREIGFYDPHYDGKTVHTAAPIEHADKDTYFCDIHLFLDRAKRFLPTKGAGMVRENLWLNLRGTALSWWTSELSDTERRIASYGNDLDEWSKLLVKRFKQPSCVAMESLLKESYALRDASAKREPREFAQRMFRTVKDAGTNDVGPQLDMIYTNIDLLVYGYFCNGLPNGPLLTRSSLISMTVHTVVGLC